jgi:ribosomal protein S28E/S33
VNSKHKVIQNYGKLETDEENQYAEVVETATTHIGQHGKLTALKCKQHTVTKARVVQLEGRN